jgi:hypothetical protein
VPKKEVTKQVVKESVKDVANAPPEYFFNLANKIKNLGKESKVKPKERTNEYNYTGKNGDEYTLTEDIGTGEMQITKDKMGVGIADDKTFDTIKIELLWNIDLEKVWLMSLQKEHQQMNTMNLE